MQEYSNRIRDPIHGFIRISDKEKAVIDHHIFQRLRNVKQLGFTYYIYPGATHTRFEHTLGVMEFVTRAFDALYIKRPQLLIKNFKAVNCSIKEAKQILRLTALLHDIGHLPCSHAGEIVLPEGKNHEDVSIELIGKSELREIITRQYSPDIMKIVILILAKGLATIPEFLILERLIKGEIDFDRTDYLMRDSLHCGVDYGTFDYRRLLETIDITEGEEGGLDIAIERGGVHCIEALLIARYFMFAQIYFHRTRRIYDYYLEKYLKEFFEDKKIDRDLTQIAKFDDIDVMEDIRRNATTSVDNPKRRWALHIYDRSKHHHLIWETSDQASYDDLETAKNIEEKLEKNYPDLDLYCDYKAEGYIHRIFLNQGEDERIFDIKIITRDKESNWIRHESSLLKSMRRRFKVIRIYGYGDHQRLKRAKSYVKQYY